MTGYDWTRLQEKVRLVTTTGLVVAKMFLMFSLGIAALMIASR